MRGTRRTNTGQRATTATGLEELFVKKDLEETTRSRRRNNDGDSRDFTPDDAGTMVGICVALLVLSVGVVTYVVCIRLLDLILSVSASLRLHFSSLQ
jgi:hypothetical protein